MTYSIYNNQLNKNNCKKCEFILRVDDRDFFYCHENRRLISNTTMGGSFENKSTIKQFPELAIIVRMRDYKCP